MSSIAIRRVQPADRALISAILEEAFDGPDEAKLVAQLSGNGDIVLELVAEFDGALAGHILFSRLRVENGTSFDAVALAPLSVASAHQGKGIGSALIKAAHEQLALMGETLSVVLGDPGYYGRFGYTHARASGFTSQYQGAYLQALAFSDAPLSGTLVYSRAFEGL